jgi:hypothetical protein
MKVVPRDASDDQVLDIVRGWIEILATGDYQSVFENLGYAIASGPRSADLIRNAIESYRSPDYFPGVTDFAVSDWRTAQGGNPTPLQKMTWFRPNSIRMVGAFAFDLPLNGRWSDLTANFVLFERDGPDAAHSLGLEDIQSYKQMQRDLAASDLPG